LQNQKETIMANHPRAAARLQAVQSYLEAEFPGCVEAAIENVIAVSQKGIRHHVVFQPTFLQQCPDYASALRESELADYIREARSQQGRRFLVIWHERTTRVRSAPG
jgi:hypothetical protein